MRVYLGYTNKKGERPVARWSNATLFSPAEGHVHIAAANERAFRLVSQDDHSFRARLNFKSGSAISLARYRKIARALWKATLECIYLDHGEFAFDARLNVPRSMVRDDRRANGYLLFPKTVNWPSGEFAITYQFVPSQFGLTLCSLATIGGVPNFTELLDREFRGDREALADTFNLVEF